MDRAKQIQYMEIKSVDDDERVIEGIASTPSVDRVGDIVEPMGAKFKLKLPFLWQHDARTPIGHVEWAEATEKGISFRARLAKITDPGPLKDDVDKAWQAIKSGLVNAVSIGFRVLDHELMKEGGWRISEWEWLELSAVTIPANADAAILKIKSIDDGQAASGQTPTPSPGASGTLPVVKRTYKNPRTKMTLKEQIAQFEATRGAKDAEREALMADAAERGETLDAEEAEQYDTLDSEITAIDKHLTRLRKQEKANREQAAPVADQPEAKQGQTGTPKVTVKPNVDKGIHMARYAMSLIRARGNRYEAAENAKSQWPDTPEVAMALKAPVASGDSTTGGWAAELYPVNFIDEFLEMLRPSTLLGRVQGLKRVPFNVSFPSQTGGGTYQWVGEGLAKPVTRATFGTVTLGRTKAAGIIVLTDELVRHSSPSAQATVRDEMIQGMARFLDRQFIDPAFAPVGTVTPGAITNAIVGEAASGVNEAAARADLRALIARFAAANYDIGRLVLLMSESVAFTLGTMVNAVGEQAFPGLSVNGGSILGIPVVTSNTVDLGGAQVVGIHAPSILLADEGGLELDISREASVIMDDDPNAVVQATGQPPVHTSMWQNNLVGLKAEHWINWGRARATAVDRITGVAYV